MKDSLRYILKVEMSVIASIALIVVAGMPITVAASIWKISGEILTDEISLNMPLEPRRPPRPPRIYEHFVTEGRLSPQKQSIRRPVKFVLKQELWAEEALKSTTCHLYQQVPQEFPGQIVPHLAHHHALTRHSPSDS